MFRYVGKYGGTNRLIVKSNHISAHGWSVTAEIREFAGYAKITASVYDKTLETYRVRAEIKYSRIPREIARNLGDFVAYHGLTVTDDDIAEMTEQIEDALRLLLK